MSFAEMRWKSEALERFRLPDIGYPVPVERLKAVIEAGGHVPFEHQLYWMQTYSEDGNVDWEALEPALLRLAELSATPDEHKTARVWGDDWFVEVMPLDLTQPTIAVQRRDRLLAAMQPRNDGRLAVAVCRPLDAKSIRSIIKLGINPDPETGRVCMRDNNWEFALDQAAQSTGAFYTYDRGESYLSLWEKGVGLVNDGTTDERFLSAVNAPQMPPYLAAAQLGIYYQLAPNRGQI